MKIYFVRHGHPNYKNDCLTELGKLQAAAAAERLADSGIEQIYASTKGRAMETAGYTAKRLGLDIVPCDFIREISWKSVDGEPILANGHPWDVAEHFVADGKTLRDDDWQSLDPFCKSVVVDSYKTVVDGIDAWLADLGYVREGEYYRVVGENTDKTVAIFSHAGSSSVALSHMFNIPFPQFFHGFHIGFTGIAVVTLSDAKGELCAPRLHLFNDIRHIEGVEVKNVFGN